MFLGESSRRIIVRTSSPESPWRWKLRTTPKQQTRSRIAVGKAVDMANRLIGVRFERVLRCRDSSVLLDFLEAINATGGGCAPEQPPPDVCKSARLLSRLSVRLCLCHRADHLSANGINNSARKRMRCVSVPRTCYSNRLATRSTRMAKNCNQFFFAQVGK